MNKTDALIVLSIFTGLVIALFVILAHSDRKFHNRKKGRRW